MTAIDVYQSWLENKDCDYHNELLQIHNNKVEIQARFGCDLSFGTGGIRAETGVGTNRMNVYVVRRITTGLANYIIEQPKGKEKGIAIAYDTRQHSYEYAWEAARVLAAKGIKVYIFGTFQPTPLLSFAVRYLKTQGGIVITASHNPCQYNGYKVYWEDGGQAVPFIAEEIANRIKHIPYDLSRLDMSEKKIIDSGLVEIIDRSIEDQYLKEYVSYPVFTGPTEVKAKNLKILYTPLHGTGLEMVEKVLKQYGFSSFYTIPEQDIPGDGFTTAPIPNPEDLSAFNMALTHAHTINPDIILATDPDCDRVGVMVRDKLQTYSLLTGNQIGALLLEYVFQRLKDHNCLCENNYVVKTVVSGDMGKKIAAAFGVRMIETLTGFKYIGEQIELNNRRNTGRFLFGYEESCGYLAGDFVRDKDGIMGVLLICQMTAYYKERGISLFDALEELYKKYGYHLEKLINLSLDVEHGQELIRKTMDTWRYNRPDKLAGYKVVSVCDYLLDDTGLPKENALKLILENGCWVCMRPSGTEPKLKFYISAQGTTHDEANCVLQNICDYIYESFSSHKG